MKKKKEEWDTTAMCCSGRDISHCGGRMARARGGDGAGGSTVGGAGRRCWAAGGVQSAARRAAQAKRGERLRGRSWGPVHTSGGAPAWEGPPGCPRRCSASTAAAPHARRRPGGAPGGPSATAGGLAAAGAGPLPQEACAQQAAGSASACRPGRGAGRALAQGRPAAELARPGAHLQEAHAAPPDLLVRFAVLQPPQHVLLVLDLGGQGQEGVGVEARATLKPALLGARLWSLQRRAACPRCPLPAPVEGRAGKSGWRAAPAAPGSAARPQRKVRRLGRQSQLARGRELAQAGRRPGQASPRPLPAGRTHQREVHRREARLDLPQGPPLVTWVNPQMLPAEDPQEGWARRDGAWARLGGGGLALRQRPVPGKHAQAGRGHGDMAHGSLHWRWVPPLPRQGHPYHTPAPHLQPSQAMRGGQPAALIACISARLPGTSVCRAGAEKAQMPL